MDLYRLDLVIRRLFADKRSDTRFLQYPDRAVLVFILYIWSSILP